MKKKNIDQPSKLKNLVADKSLIRAGHGGIRPTVEFGYYPPPPTGGGS